MGSPLPFFNWSIKKAQDTEPDSFAKARIGILFTILLFSLLKIVIVIAYSIMYGQGMQLARGVAACIICIGLIKVLLYRPSALKALANIMIIIGCLVIWSNMFVYAHKVNLVSIQFVFMVILSSFYTLGSRWGIIYSTICMTPVVLFLLFSGHHEFYFTATPQEFPSPGYEIIVVLNFISITIAHYLFYRAFHINIGEKERLNKELQLSIAEANKLAASKSDFLSTISHELRTPLNSVVGISELLLEDNPEERQLENLKILQFSALDLLSLINNVLDFNKIDSDKLVLETVPVHIAELVKNICAALKVKTVDKPLRLEVNIDERLKNITVLSDPTRLSQVIYNVVGNAIKFTDKGSVTVKLECVNMTVNHADVMFCVTDTGPGIPAEKHETIFELFTQAESRIARKYGGSGLGLAIVKKILSLFNSNIQLESTPGKGSRFFFTIPFVIDASAAVQQPVSAGRADISHLRVLVAEDNDVNRSLIKKQLERIKVQAMIVENGRQAFDVYMADYFDAILMDLHMPEWDGYETIKQTRSVKDSAKANVYIIAFTASVNEQEKIFEAGFNDFLHKPVNMSDLRDKLEKIAQYRGLSVT